MKKFRFKFVTRLYLVLQPLDEGIISTSSFVRYPIFDTDVSLCDESCKARWTSNKSLHSGSKFQLNYYTFFSTLKFVMWISSVIVLCNCAKQFSAQSSILTVALNMIEREWIFFIHERRHMTDLEWTDVHHVL